MIPGVTLICEGEVYFRKEPILLHKWLEGDSQRVEGMSGVYHRLLNLATSSVWLGIINR